MRTDEVCVELRRGEDGDIAAASVGVRPEHRTCQTIVCLAARAGSDHRPTLTIWDPNYSIFAWATYPVEIFEEFYVDLRLRWARPDPASTTPAGSSAESRQGDRMFNPIPRRIYKAFFCIAEVLAGSAAWIAPYDPHFWSQMRAIQQNGNEPNGSAALRDGS